MILLLLEALLALCLLLFMVWWTLFSGRKKGELPDVRQAPVPEHPPASALNDDESEKKPLPKQD